MNTSKRFSAITSWITSTALLTLLITTTAFAQTAPNLGSSASYGAFTGAGAIENTGLTTIVGDIGTHVGSFTGFPPGIYTGTKNVANAASLAAKNDLILAYNSLNDAAHAIMYDTVLNATMGNGQVLTPRTYRRGDLTTLSGNLTFDAKGNTEAVFIVKIGAALNVSANTKVLLANGARAANIYWAIDGAVSILDNSVFKGTILSNGAIHLYGGSTLEGRALAVVGAVTFASNMVSVPSGIIPPTNTLVVITPAPGDTVRSGAQNYKITWGGSGIASTKTFEYSLDSGATWKMIGGTSTDGFSYNWNVPDTVSNKALVRITDANNLRGISGMFSITRNTPPIGTLLVIRPAIGEVVMANTSNYAITWSGTNLTPTKTFELSLDSGLTWSTIGTSTSEAFTYAWNVPDTHSIRAIVRITDQNGVSGKSGLFTIESNTPEPSSIVVIHPVTGEIVQGGYQNFLITFTATNTTRSKTFEYSLDSGMTWTVIGVSDSDASFYTWPSVPNTATTKALVRITDLNGVTGTSALFTIAVTPNDGSIDALTLTGLDDNSNIGNGRTLGIAWAYTPDIGTSVEVEYSLDFTATWIHIATVQVVDEPSTTWLTPEVGFYNPVFVRVTSSKGMTRASMPFSIGTPGTSDVAAETTNGYSIANYPNPANASTSVSFTIPTPSFVTINISDARGILVGTVVAQQFDAGSFVVPLSTAGYPVGSYTYTMQARTTTVSGRLNVIR